jgi:hypothetical protein
VGAHSGVTLNIADNTRWSGSFNLTASGLTTASGAHSAFVADGTSTVGDRSTATLSMPVVGNGSFIVTIGGFARLEFMSSVGPGISAQVDAGQTSLLTIDMPTAFKGTAILGQTNGPSITGETIRLMDLQAADSYGYKNDILSIYSGNAVIDRLRLHNETPFGFGLQRTATSIDIVALADPRLTPPPVGLPLHI